VSCSNIDSDTAAKKFNIRSEREAHRQLTITFRIRGLMCISQTTW